MRLGLVALTGLLDVGEYINTVHTNAQTATGYGIDTGMKYEDDSCSGLLFYKYWRITQSSICNMGSH